jgi:hypothetical protein
MTQQQKEWLQKNPAYSPVRPENTGWKWLRQGYLLPAGNLVEVTAKIRPADKANAVIVGVPVFA